MTSKFDCNGNARDLKVDGLNPTKLARVFKLEESSLVLTDKNGECYMPEGDIFDPILHPNAHYIVDGIELKGNTAGEIAENRVATREIFSDLAVIQGINRDVSR